MINIFTLNLVPLLYRRGAATGMDEGVDEWYDDGKYFHWLLPALRLSGMDDGVDEWYEEGW